MDIDGFSFMFGFVQGLIAIMFCNILVYDWRK